MDGWAPAGCDGEAVDHCCGPLRHNDQVWERDLRRLQATLWRPGLQLPGGQRDRTSDQDGPRAVSRRVALLLTVLDSDWWVSRQMAALRSNSNASSALCATSNDYTRTFIAHLVQSQLECSSVSTQLQDSKSVPLLVDQCKARRWDLRKLRRHPVREISRHALLVGVAVARVPISGNQRPAMASNLSKCPPQITSNGRLHKQPVKMPQKITSNGRLRADFAYQRRSEPSGFGSTPCVACVCMITTEPGGHASFWIARGSFVTGWSFPSAHSMMSSSLRPPPVSSRKRCDPGTVLRLPFMSPKPFKSVVNHHNQQDPSARQRQKSYQGGGLANSALWHGKDIGRLTVRSGTYKRSTSSCYSTDGKLTEEDPDVSDLWLCVRIRV